MGLPSFAWGSYSETADPSACHMLTQDKSTAVLTYHVSVGFHMKVRRLAIGLTFESMRQLQLLAMFLELATVQCKVLACQA